MRIGIAGAVLQLVVHEVEPLPEISDAVQTQTVLVVLGVIEVDNALESDAVKIGALAVKSARVSRTTGVSIWLFCAMASA